MTIKLNGSTAGSVALDAPASTTSSADITFKLPVADGTAGQVLQTDGSGNLSWVTPSKILQVKHTSLTSVVSRATSNSDWGDIGLNSASFTPSSGTKNLIMVTLHASSSNTTGRFGIRVMRSAGGSDTLVPNSTGDAASNRKGVSSGYRQASTADHAPLSIIIEDTHGLNGSTAVIYKIQTIGESSDTIYLNRSSGDTDVDSYYRSISTITVMEVAA